MAHDLRSALTELLPRLRRFGTVLTGSQADGDDLVQAACERALARHAQLRAEARLDSWLYRIMRNLWTDEIRARKVRRHEGLEAAENVVHQNGVTAADRTLTLQAVRNMLTRLPEEQRVVLVLVCVDGLSYKQAAEVLDVLIGTVMSRLARGRQELYRMLEPRAQPTLHVRRSL